MDEDTLLKLLEEDGILESENCGSLQLSDQFRERYAEYSDEIMDAPEKDILVDLEPDIDVETLRPNHREFYAKILTIMEMLDESFSKQVRDAFIVIGYFEEGIPTAEGAPERFIPIHGDQLIGLMGSLERAIVYVWDYDCEPCDVVRGDLEDLMPEIPEDIALFSVFGPPWARDLQEEFNIVGAPTTLFVVDGRIDVRFQGAPYQRTLTNEFRKTFGVPHRPRTEE